MATAISTQHIDAIDGLDDEEAPAGESGLAAYLREIRRERRLTPAEELDLGRRIAEGDRHALQQMVTANVRLVIAIAKLYQGQGVELPDLVQEGNIGLLRAAQKFDYRKGYRFSTYAVWWIRQAVSRAVAAQASTIRVPTHIQEGKVPARPALEQPMPAAVATHTAPTAVLNLRVPNALDLARRARQTLSLDRMVGEDHAAFSEAIPDESTPSPLDVVCNQLLRDRLLHALDTLPARERAIVAMRYGLVDGRLRSRAEIGECIRLTRERVRQLEVQALSTLRHTHGDTELAGFLS